MRPGHLGQRGPTVVGDGDVVAVRLQIDRQRPGQRPIVVNHEYPDHDADRDRHGDDHREAATRGVLDLDGGLDRLGQPAGDGQPEPDTGTLRNVAESLERRKHRLPIDLGNARPAVHHPDLHPPALLVGDLTGQQPHRRIRPANVARHSR